MEQKNVFQSMTDVGVIAETRGLCGGCAREKAEGAKSGGVNVLTVSMRYEEALSAIETAGQAALIGAADVLDGAECETALGAGAKFIISVSYDEAMAALCQKSGAAYIPTCVTPAEMAKARSAGFLLQSFSPAASYGGAETIQAVSRLLPDVNWIVMGGETDEAMDDYAALGHVTAVGLTNVCSPKMSRADVETACKRAALRMLGFVMFHLGVNCGCAEEALATAEKLNDAFGFAVAEGPAAYYASVGLQRIENELIAPDGNVAGTTPGAFYVTTDFEIMKHGTLGKNGHIAIRTNSIERAIVYLANKGYTFNMGTAYHMGERFFTIYLNDEFGGFAVHLFQK